MKKAVALVGRPFFTSQSKYKNWRQQEIRRASKPCYSLSLNRKRLLVWLFHIKSPIRPRNLMGNICLWILKYLRLFLCSRGLPTIYSNTVHYEEWKTMVVGREEKTRSDCFILDQLCSLDLKTSWEISVCGYWKCFDFLAFLMQWKPTHRSGRL